MTVSIIIAVKDYCANLEECVSKCHELTFPYSDYEVLILPDLDKPQPYAIGEALTKLIPIWKATGDVPPPEKRDFGAKFAKGQILAFLDDDASPHKDWLNKAVEIFEKDSDIACVCGPAVTPESDSLMQKASGLVYESFLVSGGHNFRYLPKKQRYADDFPSCNFFIRKDIFDKVGGFNTKFWPGEDTFLCLKVKKLGLKMVYHPDVLVYHHRRPLLKKHLIQIKNYALHRGYFAKKFPETSLKISYFIPSLFILFIILGPILGGIYFFLISVYLFLSVLSAMVAFKEKISFFGKIKLFTAVFTGIILTHFIYGLYFIRGLLAKKMPEEVTDLHCKKL